MSPVRRILVVSPHFPPVNAPDMHRVRMSLPYFAAAGWETTVLTVADPTPLAPVDPELLATVPGEVQVVRTHCWSRRWTRWLGINNVALRAYPFLFGRGCRLLASRRFDVVYFSTTMFMVLPFGRLWRRLYGVPYVIDLQDPWVTDFYSRPGAPPPPGGWKYSLIRRLSQLMEGWTLRRAAHVIAVSADYPRQLRDRYPHLAALAATVLPFSSPLSDVSRLRAAGLRAPILPEHGFRLSFAGAISPGMRPALEVLFAAVKQLRQEGDAFSLHLHGTSYAGAGRGGSATADLARSHGLADCVHESPDRLPYVQALQVTLEADVNLLFGSTERSFVPSKLLTLLAARRPVLAIVHEDSQLARELDRLGLGCVRIRGDLATEEAIAQACASLRALLTGAAAPLPPVPPELTDQAAALTQLSVFRSVIGVAK
jgi:glycosyltransferase involved in cell wall biosynthesis